MPGVYTTAADSEQQTEQPAGKPKVPSGDQMSGKGRDEVRGASPLIDLTSRSPSPLAPPAAAYAGSVPGGIQRAVPVQLSTYARPATTRVNKAAPPHPHDNHSSTAHLGASIANATASSTFASSSVGTSLPERDAGVVATPLQQSLSPTASTQSVQSTVSAEAGSNSVPTVTNTTVASGNEAPGVPVVDGTSTHLTPVAQSAPHDQPQAVKVASSQITSAKGRGQDSAPPALVEYVNSPTNGSDTPHEPLAQVMSEPLQFGNDLTPRELPLPSSRRGTAAAVTGQIQSGTDETPVEAAPNCSQQTTTNASTLSGHPPKVGVASIQVGVVSPGNQTMTSTAMTTSEEEFPRLRMASSVGGEGSEGGGDGGEVEGGGEKSEQGSSSPRREVEEAEEEEEDSVMQLRIEDSVMELEDGDDGEMQFSRSHDGRQLGVGVVSRSGEGDEDLVMETGAHSNSIGTSPPPPPSQVGVRVHRQAGVGISDGRSTRGEEPNGVKYPKPQHYRPMGFHGNANSHLMKGSVATVSPSLLRDDRGGMDERVVFGGGRVLIGEREKGGVVSSTGDNGDILPSYRVRKVAKVKQFFTTLQRFGDRQSSEVAEQVQELIAALVNGTATIEEFHQEIQTVTNHPLRQFIIPFLRENLDLFREALRDSEQALSDVLFHPPSSSSSASIAMTPQFIDEDLPVLPSSKPPLTPTLSSHTPHSSSSSSSLPLTAEPAAHASFIHHSATNATTNIHRSVHSQTHPLHPVTTMNFDPAPDTDSAQNSPIPRKRTTTDRASMQSDIHSTIITDKTLKRPRQDINHAQPSVAVNTVTMPSIRCGPVPSSGAGSYPPVLTPHQQHTSHSPHEVSLSHPPHTPTLIGGHTPSQGFHPLPSRKQLLAEDWSYIDMMLNSVVGMVEKGRNAMAILRERALNSNSDLERREQEQQKIAEATEKARRHWQEQKIHLQREAARKLKETVAQVRGEMEQKMAQAQSMAVQEALKEANAQSNSKESCWNCGRRATETCSGCNKARYCGTFCQHKDWGSHMHQCASGIAGMADDRSGSTSSAGTTRVIIQSGDAHMTSSIATEEPPDIKPRISPEQLMAIPQITVRYPMT